MTRLDLATLHEAIAAELADEPCVIVAGRSWSWTEVTDRTRRLAALLRGAGLGGPPRLDPGPVTSTGQDHLGLLLPNGLAYLEATLAAAKASVAPFNINYRYTGSELGALLRDAQPAALVYAGRYAEVLAEVLPTSERRPLLLQVADPSGAALLDGALDYEAAIAGSEPALFEPAPDDRHLLYTGGTTGLPRGVIWRVADLVAGPFGVRDRDSRPLTDPAAAVRRALAARGRTLPASPLMHGAGLGVALGGWLGGSTVVIPDRPESFDAAAFLDCIERDRVTMAMIIGDAFGAPIVAEQQARPRDLSSLRLLVSSGAALRPDLKAALVQAAPGLRITDFIGSSEGMKAHKDPAGSNRIQPSPGVAVLSEDRTRVLGPADTGETGWLAAGGAVPLGYLNDPEKTAATFLTVAGRRFSVGGDRARIVEDGSIEFLGRDATTINTGGEKVYADEVEQVIRALPGVADALVVGRPSQRWGQEVVALVQLEIGGDLSGLGPGLRAGLAGYKVPKAFIEVDRVQRHANGKPDYAWAGRAAAAD
jgi:acyl-CoA synthetase (AMP-forming)/AMP-acid ligase II